MDEGNARTDWPRPNFEPPPWWFPYVDHLAERFRALQASLAVQTGGLASAVQSMQEVLRQNAAQVVDIVEGLRRWHEVNQRVLAVLV